MQASESARLDVLDRLPFGTHLNKHGRLVKTAAMLGLGLFIALGPAAGQIFGLHSVFLREWIMFSGAGVGVLKGSFTLVRSDGAVLHRSPLEMLGLQHYPSDPPYDFARRVFGDADLEPYARDLCGQPGTTLVSFHGWVGTRQGWRAIDVKDVCSLPPPPPADPAGER